MKFKRQKLLIFEGGIGDITPPLMFDTLVFILSREINFLVPFIDSAAKTHSLLEQLWLQLVRRAMIIEISPITQLQPDIVLPKCLTYNILDACSDKVNDFYFGYKH